MGLAPTTFKEFAAPLGEKDFLDLLVRRQLHCYRSENGAAFASWLGWQPLRRLLARGEHPKGQHQLRLSKESDTATQSDYSTGGRIDLEKVDALLADGYSIVINHFEPFVPPLAVLCRELRARLGETCYAGLITTVGKSGAFKVHYDPEDLAIVQIEGTKRWTLYGPPVDDPIMDLPRPNAPPDKDVIFETVLEPGDVLFVPAGQWHHCEAGPGVSIHLGMFFYPPSPYHAVKAVLADLAADQRFRRPLTRINSVIEFESLEKELRDVLRQRADEFDLKRLLVNWKAHLIGSVD